MWSRIDPLLQVITRKVEQSDPRMELRKDESGQQGFQKKNESHTPAPIPWEDTTVVSVQALIGFLGELLTGAVGAAPPSENKPDAPPPSAPPPHTSRSVAPYMTAISKNRRPLYRLSLPYHLARILAMRNVGAWPPALFVSASSTRTA